MIMWTFFLGGGGVTYECVWSVPRVPVAGDTKFHQDVNYDQGQIGLGQMELIVGWLERDNKK